MIFTFPAIVSENVDQRLLPAITKSLEQYYLNHMIVAINSGSIRPYIDVDSTGHATSIRMESLDYFDELLPNTVIQETSKWKGDIKDINYYQLKGREQDWMKKRSDEDQNQWTNRVSGNQAEIRNILLDINKEFDNVSVAARENIQKKVLDSLSQYYGKDLTKDDLKLINDTLSNISTTSHKQNKDVSKLIKTISQIDKNNKKLLTDLQKTSSNKYNQIINAISNSDNKNSKTLNDILRQLSYGKQDLNKSTKKIIDAIKTQKEIDEKDLEEDPRQQIGGISKRTIKFEVPPGLGFTPTMATIDTTVWIRSSNPGFSRSKQWVLMPKSLIIGVKVIPTIAKNFNSMYEILRDDYYANVLRYMFKGASRTIMRALYNNPIIKKLKRWYELALGRSGPDEMGGSPADWYFNILLSKKALLNSSGFKSDSSGLSYRQYTSAIAIMNKDEKEDLFDDPSRLQRLFNMGWNSFVIMDDRNKKATFCSNLDRGRCIMLPYSFIMHSLKAGDLYKSYEDLERASGGFFRRMKSSSLNIKKLVKEHYVNSLFERYKK